ncbi:hypothetical protein [Clostridium sp. JN-9]|uniref:hypothetical protein n=1 Tax=Clostridium sp. JN-9 TaxID=2507159 RepID=UPI000FFE0D60|nr:hypothetical protein [Clostridium sp. JN-9]QAT41041.1 hypothetical protein EQM05_12625 [Clostridium sp. JN-9]
MNNSFFALIALCVTALALVAMVLGFCYKQDKGVSLKGKAKANKKGVSSELALDIDNKNKKDKKETNQ